MRVYILYNQKCKKCFGVGVFCRKSREQFCYILSPVLRAPEALCLRPVRLSVCACPAEAFSGHLSLTGSYKNCCINVYLSVPLTYAFVPFRLFALREVE